MLIEMIEGPDNVSCLSPQAFLHYLDFLIIFMVETPSTI